MVSLVPSVTETLLTWGVEPVGVTRWCEHPELTQVGGTKDPDIAAVISLRPDLVVMDEEENRREDADRLEAAGCAVHALAVRAVSDVGPQLAALAARLGLTDRWKPPLLAPPSGPARRVFVPIWRERRAHDEPSFTTLSDDTYGASLLAAVGMVTVYAGDEARYPVTSLAEAASRCPDVVLAPSEPYKFSRRHQPELERIAPVIFVDGQDLFWWGARTVGALGRLRLLVSG